MNTGQSVTILGSLKGIMCNLRLTKIVTNYVKASKKITVLFFLFNAYFNTCQNQKKIMTLSFMKQLELYEITGVNLAPRKNLNIFVDELVLIALKIHPT